MTSPADDFIIRSVSFESEGGLSAEYMCPSKDIRRNGLVVQHMISLPANTEYDDDIDQVRDVAAAVVRRALLDLEHVPAASWDEDTGEPAEQRVGPYDNPEDVTRFGPDD